MLKEPDNRDLLFRAMRKAIDAFENYLSKQGVDAAYFALYLTGYTLTDTFQKHDEIRLNFNDSGHETFQYPDKENEHEN